MVPFEMVPTTPVYEWRHGRVWERGSSTAADARLPPARDAPLWAPSRSLNP